MEAVRVWSSIHGPVAFGSPGPQRIFEWYSAQDPPGVFAIGSLFTGAFFFDEAIWPIHVPLGYGTFSLGIDEMLAEMTRVVGERLSRSGDSMSILAALAADCIDYGYGFDDLRNEAMTSPLARNMLVSGDKELRAAVDVLLSKRPTQKVAETAALALEMFLKSYLAQHAGLDERGARLLNHRLDESLDRCLAHEPTSDLRTLDGALGTLPKIGDRYEARARGLQELWYAYSLAQFAGACVVRSMTDRDCRAGLTEDPVA